MKFNKKEDGNVVVMILKGRGQEKFSYVKMIASLTAMDKPEIIHQN